MKKIIFIFILSTFLPISAQVIIIDKDAADQSSAVNTNAVLELRSDNKGMIIPRIPTEPILTNADAGMIFYDTTKKCLKAWDGDKWQELSACRGVSSIIGTQNFETTQATPNLVMQEVIAGSYSSGNGAYPSTPMYVSGSRGYQANNKQVALSFGPVDASSFSSATLKFRLASFSGTSGNGNDATDIVSVGITTDGGATSTQELIIKPAQSNVRYGFDAIGTASIQYTGSGTAVTVETVSGNNGITYVTITGLPNSANLGVGVLMRNNSSGEFWVIDDVVLEGIY